MSRLVVLEGLKDGNKFITSYKKGTDSTKLLDGTVAYKVIGYFEDTPEGMREAQKACGFGISRLIDAQFMSNYLFKTGMGSISKEKCNDLAVFLTGDFQYE